MPTALLSIYRFCLRCGPHVETCKKTKGKKCVAPTIVCADKKSYDQLLKKWHDTMAKRRTRKTE